MRPCCIDEQEFRDKLLAAYSNLFLGHCWLVPAQSRFTHVRATSNIVLLGILCHNILQKTLPSDGADQVFEADAVDAEAAGAGELDYQHGKSKRLRRVVDWLSREALVQELVV
jgi:hypothetical protein